jgi:hypothetical protein
MALLVCSGICDAHPMHGLPSQLHRGGSPARWPARAENRSLSEMQ